MLAGTLITPQATVHSLLVNRVAPAAASGEAFAWVVTAVTLGLGIGQGIAGPLYSGFGAAPALLGAAAIGLLVAGLAWLRRATLLPDAASPSPTDQPVAGSISPGALLATNPKEHGMNTTTLYLSDLDGTLLASNGTLSAHTRDTLNGLTADGGLLFSYATARSFESASVVLAGLEVPMPVAVYGGALIVDGQTGEVLTRHGLEPAVVSLVLAECHARDLPPIVYEFRDARDRVCWNQAEESPGTRNYTAIAAP